MVTYDGPIAHQADEVAWGGWMTPDDLRAHLADPTWPFVPDGRALIERLLAEVERRGSGPPWAVRSGRLGTRYGPGSGRALALRGQWLKSGRLGTR